MLFWLLALAGLCGLVSLPAIYAGRLAAWLYKRQQGPP